MGETLQGKMGKVVRRGVMCLKEKLYGSVDSSDIVRTSKSGG